ncbi:hypothetical protein [Polaromonas sp.]|uniref:hypothetical protein n=1 Tax=Polaromonas sp. TaxID=1869339 RepID=UPI0035645812
MNPFIQRTVCVLALVLAAACSETSDTADKLTPAAQLPASKPGFVNKVWEVGLSSGVSPGMLYVFLSDGTLAMTSPNSKATFGAWTLKDGAFTMIEDSLAYRVDILSLSDDAFRIRSHNPGGSVEISMVPAKSAPLAP